MSDENKEGKAGQGDVQELVQNLKAEFARKLENVSQQSKVTNDNLQALINQVQARQAETKTQEYSKRMNDLYVDDPEAWSKKVQEEAEAKAVSKAEERLNQIESERASAQAKQAQVLSELTSMYPELNIPGHRMQKKVMELYNALPEDQRNSSIAYKYITKEAAEELGIKPVSKRSEEEMEDFLPYGRGSNSSRRKSNKLDPRTEKFAQIMGLDVTNDDVKKELLSLSQETPHGWMQYKDSHKGER